MTLHEHWCPGCSAMHQIAMDTPFRNGARWIWDGNAAAPTFSPSIRIAVDHCCTGQEGKDCWCTFETRIGWKPPVACGVCHYFIRSGRIEFSGDSSHTLAGQTVDLPHIPADKLD
ncbi:DUF6527 family protein [Azospirillum baldaniorum]|nr:DUF6527 family protein [Azospirillum baldaniorum]